MKEYSFSGKQLENSLENLEKKGITEVTVNDKAITSDRAVFLRFLGKVRSLCPNVHFSFFVQIDNIDTSVVKALCEIYSSITIDLPENVTTDAFVRKNLNKKIGLLNDFGIVYGFIFPEKIPSFKVFKNLLDFSINLYPNHLEFYTDSIIPTATLSSVDIKKIKTICFSVATFYTSGRAVPWFLSACHSLKIRPAHFFSDFAEWQLCNNCDESSMFSPQTANHIDIEKMQLLFLKLKYEEKNIVHYFPVISDFVKIQGAFSRAAHELIETIVELSYHPEDVLSAQIYDIADFYENACMEYTTVRVFPGDLEPSWEIV
ncbi:MAG: hypothetical protein GX220_01705 [Treponema sp.]|nr:hypothetical protein [Treponema sp.]